MIFSNPDNAESYRIKILEVKFTPGGRLRLKAIDKDRPKLKPGYITFSEADYKKLIKAIKEHENE